MTAAGVILVIDGVLGIVYAPFLAPAVWMFLGLGLSAYTVVGVLNLATGIGLIRLYGWARPVAGLLASASLVLLDAPALVAAAGSGDWMAVNWLGIAGSLLVLFAVLRRWPR